LSIFFLYVKNIEHQSLVSFLLTSIYQLKYYVFYLFICAVCCMHVCVQVYMWICMAL
jgi:hypothetical protein